VWIAIGMKRQIVYQIPFCGIIEKMASENDFVIFRKRYDEKTYITIC
jgi:hypothetical protein